MQNLQSSDQDVNMVIKLLDFESWFAQPSNIDAAQTWGTIAS